VKPSVSDPTVALYVDWAHNETVYVVNIPKTNIDFDTYYSADFYMEP